MTEDAILDPKVTGFFEWLALFEARVHRVGGGAQRYTAHAIETTVRYSWFKPSAAGLPSICLADFRLAQPLQGIRFLERLVLWFERMPHALHAQVLYVERPQDRAVRDWLGEHGFSLCSASGEVEQSWYLRRPERQAGADAQSTTAAAATAARVVELKSYEGGETRRSGKNLNLRTPCKAPVALDSRRHPRVAASQVPQFRWPSLDAPRVRALAR